MHHFLTGKKSALFISWEQNLYLAKSFISPPLNSQMVRPCGWLIDSKNNWKVDSLSEQLPDLSIKWYIVWLIK